MALNAAFLLCVTLLVCTPAGAGSGCGNGQVETGEGCDDGNTLNGDGCNASCLVELGAACLDGPSCASGICTNGVCVAAAYALDVDDNGTAEPLTDGLLVLRYLFGFRGAVLVSGAVAVDCGRCLSGAIESYLGGIVPP